jgi:hypothetical protein
VALTVKLYPELARVVVGRVGVGSAAELAVAAGELALISRFQRVDCDEAPVILPSIIFL